MQKESISLRDRIAGCLMGCALGDALGVPHEFRFHKKNIYTGLLYIVPEYHFQFSHRKDVIGQYSDDTEMTLCTVRALIESKGVYNRDVTIEYYRKWASTAKAMGTNTRNLFKFKGINTMKCYENRYKKYFEDKPEEEWTQSNGSLMRCSILSFFGKDVVIEDCKLTNPHPINIDSSRLYSYLIRMSVKGLDKDEIVKSVKKIKLHESVKSVFEDAISPTAPLRDVTGKSKGWVLHALYCACWAWYYAKSYQEGVDMVIRLGGDTDTNGAIAGALLGTIFGLEAMNKEKNTSKNIKILLNADTTQGENPIPEYLQLKDFDEMIDTITSYVVL